MVEADDVLRELLGSALSGADRSDALRAFREDALQRADEDFGPQESGIPFSRFLSAACDLMVQECVGAVQHPGAAWVATGGYGRGLMSPGSAVRLVLLHDGQRPRAAEHTARKAEELLEEAGNSSAIVARTVGEALRQMTEDYVTAVGMMDTRLVAGVPALHEECRRRMQEQFLPNCWGSFGQEALSEALSRRDPFTSSPYCTEPNLKDGAGGLRDIGLLQKVNDALAGMGELTELLEPAEEAGAGLLSAEESSTLEEALDFLLRARNRLHLAEGEPTDVLHRAAQPPVAEALGFDDSVAGEGTMRLMRQIFQRTGRIRKLLRAFQERFGHLYRVAWRGCQPLPRRELGDGLAEVDGDIYNTRRPPFESGEAAARIMRVFRLSQRRHLPVAQELLEQVGGHLHLVDEAFRSSPQIGELFLDLLAGSVGVAERVAWMRDCGLLQAYLPEFAPLVHTIDPEKPADYTLDEHAVEALRVVDELGHTRQRSELAQRAALEQVERVDLLRLGILLHDVDSVPETDAHEAVEEVAERIGLKPAERDDLHFMMRNRGTLWACARERSFEEPGVLEELSVSVGTADRLTMLYLATYAHNRALGPLAWFAWRDAQLYELYQMLMAQIVPDYTPFATSEYFRREFRELAARADRADRADRFLELVPDLYKMEVAPAEALEHLELIQKIKGRPGAMSRSVGARDATVWVCTSDVPARFAQIAGVFTYSGLDISEATAFTLRDGTVLDRFVVHGTSGLISPDPGYWEGVEDNLVESIRGALNVRAALQERAGPAGPESVASHRRVTTIHLDNASSAQFTLLDVVTRDRPGLLFDIAATLGGLGLNIELARIRTRGELAQDVFFLTDSDSGRKITGSRRLEEVREQLLAATPGPEQCDVGKCRP